MPKDVGPIQSVGLMVRSSVLLISPLESPMFSMASLQTHLGAGALSVQPGSGQVQAKGGWLSSFRSKAVGCRIVSLLQCLWIWIGRFLLER